MNDKLFFEKLLSKSCTADVYSDTGGRFADVRDANVLIYWPHGVGDWVFLSHVLPTLEPSNRYWVTRYGDDTVSLLEGNKWAVPLYTGIQSPHCDDGGVFGNRHFGLNYESNDGSNHNISLPFSLYNAFSKNDIRVILNTSFPETCGHSSFPYHTKARNMIKMLTSESRRSQMNLAAPLKNSMSFEVSLWLTRLVEARLACAGRYGKRKLCLIGRNGYTSVGKNWGHLWRDDLPEEKRREGEECRDFMRLMLKHDPNWLFLILEDRLFDGDDTVRSAEYNAISYAELFGEIETSVVPFGVLMKTLINVADLAIGVPAGPFHLCMAKPELPTVGIWIEHFPSWYEEPKSASIHVASHNIRSALSRSGTFEKNGEIDYRVIWSDTRVVQGEQVFEAVRKLLN